MPRYRNFDVNKFALRFQEETSAATETTHSGESAGYVVLATQVELDEDGIADSWELANGLNPTDPSDAALDPDNDGVANVDEYRYATNPGTFDSGGTVTVEVITPDAFEKEGTSARLRVHRTGGTVHVTVYFTLTGRAQQPGGTVRITIRREEPGGLSLAR